MANNTPLVPEKKPVTLLDWAGNPYTPEQGETYGGKQEQWPASERMRHARQALALQPLTDEQRERKREAMKHARGFRKRVLAKVAKAMEKGSTVESNRE